MQNSLSLFFKPANPVVFSKFNKKRIFALRNVVVEWILSIMRWVKGDKRKPALWPFLCHNTLSHVQLSAAHASQTSEDEMRQDACNPPGCTHFLREPGFVLCLHPVAITMHISSRQSWQWTVAALIRLTIRRHNIASNYNWQIHRHRTVPTLRIGWQAEVHAIYSDMQTAFRQSPIQNGNPSRDGLHVSSSSLKPQDAPREKCCAMSGKNEDHAPFLPPTWSTIRQRQTQRSVPGFRPGSSQSDVA